MTGRALHLTGEGTQFDTLQAFRCREPGPGATGDLGPRPRAFGAQVIVTNTVPVPPERSFPELTVLSVANLLGETIWRVYNSSSVTQLF